MTLQTGAFNNSPAQETVIISNYSVSELPETGKTNKQVQDPHGLLYTTVVYGMDRISSRAIEANKLNNIASMPA